MAAQDQSAGVTAHLWGGSEDFCSAAWRSLSASARISSNASQYFFLCGELLKERQMVLRNRSNSKSSMVRSRLTWLDAPGHKSSAIEENCKLS
jgi:hypothetical protein